MTFDSAVILIIDRANIICHLVAQRRSTIGYSIRPPTGMNLPPPKKYARMKRAKKLDTEAVAGPTVKGASTKAALLRQMGLAPVSGEPEQDQEAAREHVARPPRPKKAKVQEEKKGGTPTTTGPGTQHGRHGTVGKHVSMSQRRSPRHSGEPVRDIIQGTVQPDLEDAALSQSSGAKQHKGSLPAKAQHKVEQTSKHAG